MPGQPTLRHVLPALPAAAAGSGQAPPPLRYFAQPDGVQGSSTPYGDNPQAGHVVQAGDAKIWYETYGSGRPLLVFHGGGVGSPYELGALLDALRRDFRLVVVSTRGHGRSEIGHSPLTFEQKVDDMLAVMDEVTKAPAPILGFSDGAYTACRLAALHPERVERIVAMGAGTLEAGYFPPAIRVEDLEAVDRAYVDQMRRLMPQPGRLQEFLSAYMAFWSGMSVGRETFGAIRCPVLLLAGDEDDHAPVLTVLEAHQMIANSRLCIIPRAWHTAFLDEPRLVLAAVSRFLRADAATLAGSRKLSQNNVPQAGDAAGH